MDEFELIRRYFDRQQQPQDVRVGIGDDGAVLAPPIGTEIVNVIDTMIAEVHFPRELGAADVGYRAVAINLSDIAAMGSCPRWMTLALTLAEVDTAWLTEFSGGMFEAADRFGVSLVGGDTTNGSQLVISVQITGTITPGSAMTRSGANAGDLIFVTGTPGDAAAGLQLLQNGEDDGAHAQALVSRFCRPEARVAFGEMIAALASAAIDVSDGLFGDLQKLLQASNVAGMLELSELPLSRALTSLFDREQAVDFALGGGDDYELCFTARPEVESQILQLADAVDLRVTRIGTVGDGGSLVCTDGGEVVEYRHAGYRHFEEGSDS